MKWSTHRRRTNPGCAAPRPALCAGLMQADCEGQVWLCEAVIRNGELADYFLVRLSRVDGGRPVGDPVVLSPSEYEAFSRRHQLQAVLL
jgi:hypothetical protein